MPWRTIGQEPARRLLAAGLAHGRLAHAYLLTGPANSGKATLALDFACALACTGDKPPCGECADCRQVLAGTHPDVEQVELEGGDPLAFSALWDTSSQQRPRRALNIERARDVMRLSALRPTQAPYRIITMDGNAIQDVASSALLKLFEEPAARTILILRAAADEAVPPPIVSRCQVVRLHPVPTATIIEWLTRELGQDDAVARQCAALSGGRPGLAKRLAETEGALAAVDEQAARWLALATAADTADLFDQARQWGHHQPPARDYPVVRAALDLAGVVWRELLRQGARAEAAANGAAPPDGAPALPALRSAPAEQLGRLGLAALGRQLALIAQASRLLDANVQPRLLLEWLFLDLAREAR